MSILDRFWFDFLWILASMLAPKRGGRRSFNKKKKTLKKQMVFEHFCFFSQLANKRPLDQCFGQLCFQLGVHFFPKSFPRCQHSSNMAPKMAHLGLKMGVFGQFGFEVGRPRDQKTLKNKWFLSLFAFSTNLPTRGHLINLLASLASNLVQNLPKYLPRCLQHRSKI